MDITDKLKSEVDRLKAVFPNLQWYGKKRDLNTIDDEAAVLTYTTDTKNADGKTHWAMVTLTLYLINDTAHTYELYQLGYELVDEVAIDEQFNATAAYQKRVVLI